MIRQQWLQQMICLSVATLLVLSCSAIQSWFAAPTPTLTPTPMPAQTPTSTPTPIPPPPTLTPIPANFTIMGRIANLGKFSEHVVEGSSLQLVHLSDEAITNQQVLISLAFNEDGTINIVSDSARTPVPTDGFFTFEFESLEPGIYLVVLQFPYIEGSWVNIMALTNNDEGELAVWTGDLKYNATTNQFIRYLSLSPENSAKIAMIAIPADSQSPFLYDFGEVFMSKLPVRYP